MRPIKLVLAVAITLMCTTNALDYMAIYTECCPLTRFGLRWCPANNAAYFDEGTTGHFINNAWSGCYDIRVPNSKFPLFLQFHKHTRALFD